MTDPRNLPCGHVFCLQCIRTLFENQFTPGQQTAVLECPNRCGGHEVTLQAIDSFPKNFALNSIIEAINQNGVCQAHKDFIGFIDITSGELLCGSCVNAALSVDPESASATSVSRKCASGSQAIRSFAAADNILKSSLTNLTAHSDVRIAKLEEECRNQKDTKKMLKEFAEKEISTSFDVLQAALNDQCERIQKNLTKVLSELRIAPNTISELRAISQSLQNATSQAMELLTARSNRTAQPPLASFLQSCVKLQSALKREVETADNIIEAIEEFHTGTHKPYILTTINGLDNVLKALSALELCAMKIIWVYQA